MELSTSQIFEKMIRGDRIALGKAMTLVESERDTDRSAAIELLGMCENKLRGQDNSIRFAVSGSPGVGKSTFIEALGLKAIENGHKTGVMTIDPTSSISHGSILGDKSRMSDLSRSPEAFVRSSPAGKVLGGIGRRSHEVMTLLATSGYDLILVETVGVGQSEHLAWQLTDGFILVVQPGGGDELQGIKRGITELADILIVNKADGAMTELAKLAKAHYKSAMHYFSSLRNHWTPKTLTCSSITGDGIPQVLDVIESYRHSFSAPDVIQAARVKQKTSWLNWTLRMAIEELVESHPIIREKLKNAEHEIAEQKGSVFQTAFDIEQLISHLIRFPNQNNS